MIWDLKKMFKKPANVSHISEDIRKPEIDKQ